VDFDGLDDPRLTLSDALTSLAKTWDVTFEVNERAFKLEVGVTGAQILAQPVARSPLAPMRNVPRAEILRAILARLPVPSGATFVYRNDCIEITTRRQAFEEGREAIPILLEDFALRAQFVDWTNLDEYVVDTARLGAAMAYWHRVTIENAKALAAEGKPLPRRERPQAQ
jgi:hypothetical protein